MFGGTAWRSIQTAKGFDLETEKLLGGPAAILQLRERDVRLGGD